MSFCQALYDVYTETQTSFLFLFLMKEEELYYEEAFWMLPAQAQIRPPRAG